MSLILQLPPATQFYQPVVTFLGTFGAPTVGEYDFNAAANQNKGFQLARKQHLYLFERYSFSATIPEGDYFSNINTIPTLEIRKPRETNAMIHPTPIPLTNYYDGIEVLMWAFVNQDQTLTASAKGVLDQGLALVGIPTITIQVQFNIYEVKNLAWIDNFLGRTKHGQAPDLVSGLQGRKR